MSEYIRLITKKEKKKRQYKKNRAHERMFHLMRLRRAEAVRVKNNEEMQKPKRGPASPKAPNDKVSQIRNRLTGKKRESKERWNRFAGTSDAGGRGL